MNPTSEDAPTGSPHPSGTELFHFYERLREDNVVLAFKGAMSQDALIELGDLLKGPIGLNSGLARGNVRKLFAIMVEMAQNILNYSIEREYVDSIQKDVGVGLIIIQETKTAYSIGSGNRIKTDDADRIAAKIDRINAMDGEQLRQYYTSERKRHRSSKKNGAGLGFIDIARRSGHPLGYTFHQQPDGNVFFTLAATVEKTLTGS